MICPFCGTQVTESGPCETCVPRLTDEEKQRFEQLNQLSEQELLLALGCHEQQMELKEIIYMFVDIQPERKLNLDVIIARIRSLYPTEHAGSIKRAIRFLIDEGMANQVQDTLILN